MRELTLDKGEVLVAPSGAEYSVVKVRLDYGEATKQDTLVFFLYATNGGDNPTRLDVLCEDEFDFYNDDALFEILDENSYEVHRYYTFSYTLYAPSREEAYNDFYEALSDASCSKLGATNLFELKVGDGNVTK